MSNYTIIFHGTDNCESDNIRAYQNNKGFLFIGINYDDIDIDDNCSCIILDKDTATHFYNHLGDTLKNWEDTDKDNPF